MSSYSRCSVNSQKLLAEQDVKMAGQAARIEEMRVEAEKVRKEAAVNKLETESLKKLVQKLMDSQLTPADMEVDPVTTPKDSTVKTKKRLPSGSPVEKSWESADSGTDDDEDLNASKEDVKLSRFKKGKKELKQMSKKEMKKARRLEKAKENKLEAQAQAQARAQSQPQVPATATETDLVAEKIGQNAVNDTKRTFDGEGSIDSVVKDLVGVGPGLRSGETVSVSAQGLSYSGVVSGGAHASYTTLGFQAQNTGTSPVLATPVFRTPMPDGPFKDEIVVEVNSLNGKQYSGTVTVTEARKTIFEQMLGFKQDDLASLTIGYNRGRIITYKLKQQMNVDELYEWEYFEIERKVGNDVNMLGCKIRGLRNPANRPTHISKAARSEPNDQHQDDGTRVVRIIGCEYRLTESEILNWLVKFGEVKSEITEEILQEEDGFQDPTLPPVGNGTYLVTMKLKKDMPNWVPMYGRRVRLEYKGIRKQCNNCYGKHIKKYCKSDKVKMEEFAEIFKTQFPEIPEDHYGWLAKIRPEAVAKPRSELLLNQASGGQAQDGVQAMVNPNPLDSGSSKIKFSLRNEGYISA